MLRQDDFIKSQLVLTGWRFGKEYGGYLPALMVMGCLANRYRLGWGSWLEILDRVPLYLAENTMPTGTPDIWEPNFMRLLREVDGVYDGSGMDYSKGALYWCDLRRVERDWFRDNIVRKSDQHPRIVDCNSLVLFR